jgi:hypothetical protein
MPIGSELRTRGKVRVLGALALLVSVSAAPAPASAETGAAPEPSAQVLQVLSRIQERMKVSKYTHSTRVDEKAGRYEFDCSGMASWVLRRAAPKAHGAVAYRGKTGRPLARDFYSQIAASRKDKARYGWQRVTKVGDAKAGDVIAWLKPKELKSVNTGHVAFLTEAPKKVHVPSLDLTAYLVRIADASRYQHEDDTRTDTDMDGFGIGTIVVLADPHTDEPVAYGWFGLRSAWLFRTQMAIGRVAG